MSSPTDLGQALNLVKGIDAAAVPILSGHAATAAGDLVSTRWHAPASSTLILTWARALDFAQLPEVGFFDSTATEAFYVCPIRLRQTVMIAAGDVSQL